MQPHPPGKRHGAGGKLVPRERGQGPGHPKPQGPEQTRPASAQPPAQQATATETPRSSRGGAPRPRELEVGQRARGRISLLRGPKAPGHTRGGTEAQAGGRLTPQGPRASVPTAPSVIRATLHPALLPALKDPPHASELPGGKPAPHLPAPASRAGRSSGKSTAGNRKRGSHRLPGAVTCAHRAGQA